MQNQISRSMKILAATLATAGASLLVAAAAAPGPITWNFDRLDKIGGVATTVEGNPKIVASPVGKAVEFDGVDDMLMIEQHPLAGAATFTFEAIFRPDGGENQQRWFHLAEIDPKTGLSTSKEKTTNEPNARFLFEIRVVNDNQWYLDAFMNGPGYNKALMFRDKLYPTGKWYHVAQVYDGKMFRSYVNGELQGEAEVLTYKPQLPGRAAVGVRMNKVNYFKGAVAMARFTHRPLTPAEFVKLPPQK
jgi:hypothetical protein